MIWTENAPTAAGWYWWRAGPEYRSIVVEADVYGYYKLPNRVDALPFGTKTGQWGSEDGTTPTPLEPPQEV